MTEQEDKDYERKRQLAMHQADFMGKMIAYAIALGTLLWLGSKLLGC